MVNGTMRILTVSELVANLKALVETSFGTVWVVGEVSNLRMPASGHRYFILKDASSNIRAVMFRQSAVSLGFSIEEGQSLVCRGRLTVYTARGDCQIVVDAVEPRGIGALQTAFEQLKLKLQAEGLFDRDRKRPLPPFPEKIGIITSPTGAAVRDILTVIGRRFPACSIVVAPVRVQGSEAAAETVEALELLNSMDDIDVIIIARGGGSIEDLQSFNDENLARAIARSRIPVISAVGHETDFTIADFVADLRAPTPSAAGELVVPDKRELAGKIASLASMMAAAFRTQQREKERRVSALTDRVYDPRGRINDLRIYLDEHLERLERAIKHRLERMRMEVAASARSLRHLNPLLSVREKRRAVQYLMNKAVLQTGYFRGRARGRVEQAVAVLNSMSPEAVLKRGYSITRRYPEGVILNDAGVLQEGDQVSVRVMKGIFRAAVTHVSREETHGGKEI